MEVLLASAVSSIYERVQNVKVYKHRCNNLSSRCNLLVNVLREEGGTNVTSAHADAMNEALSTMESVMGRVERWAKLSTMRSFMQQDQIRRKLEELDSMVDTCLSRYQIRMGTEMAKTREEQYEAMLKDNLELRDTLNELLRSSINYSNDRTSLACSPALQIVMDDIEEEHRETQTVASANISYHSQSLDGPEGPRQQGFQLFCKSLVALELNQPIEQIAQAATPPKIRSSPYGHSPSGQSRPQQSVRNSTKSLVRVPSWLASSTSLRRSPPQIPPLQLGGNVVWHIGPWTAEPSSPPRSGRASALSVPDTSAGPSGGRVSVSAATLQRANSAMSGVSMSSTRSSFAKAGTSKRLPTPPTPDTSIPSAPGSPPSPPGTIRSFPYSPPSPPGTIRSFPYSPPSPPGRSSRSIPYGPPSPGTSVSSIPYSPPHLGRRRPSALVSLTPLETALTIRSSCYIWKSDPNCRVISKATMEGLIDYFLLTTAEDDPDQYNNFFIGHLSVISPQDVLQKIKRRFEEAMTSPLQIQVEVQYCVMRLINDWLQNENVSLGQFLLTEMKDFVSTITAHDEVAPDGIVLQIVQGIQAKASMNLPPPPITSSFNPDIHQGPTPTDLAFALARQEAEIYRRILPSEFIAHACKNEDGCANLSAALLLARRIKFWVQSSILDLEFGMDKAGLERRSETKRFFIIVAEECHKIGNFSSFHAIMDALESPAVAGLALTHSRMLPREQRRMSTLVKASSTLDHPPKQSLHRHGCIPCHDTHLKTIKALMRDLQDVDEQYNPPMLNCEKWIALREAAASAVRFQETLHMYYESLPADRQRRDTAVEYLRAGLRKINPEEDITQALLLKSDKLKVSEEFLRTGRPAPPLPRQ